MQFIDRNRVPVPVELSSKPFQAFREDYLRYLSLDPKERAQTRPPNRNLPESPDLRRALAALFHGKCAFCESPSDALRVYRFRPTSEALPMAPRDSESFLHYGWLADAWQNLYPICPDCMPKRANYFPVTGQRTYAPSQEDYLVYTKNCDGIWPYNISERPILLDPCEDKDLVSHLQARSTGELEGLSKRGNETIEHFRLNRVQLVAARKKALERFRNGRVVEITAERPFAGFLRSHLLEPLPSRAPARRKEIETEAIQVGDEVQAEVVPAEVGAVDWRLTTIDIQAFKSLEHIHVEMPPESESGMQPALLILGENAAGKSSFLEAFSLAMIEDEARDDLGEAPSELPLDPNYLGAGWQRPRKQAEVRLGFTDGDGSSIERVLKVNQKGFRTKGVLPENLPVFAYGAYRHFRESYRNWRPSRPVRSLFHSDDLLSNPERWLMTLTERRFDMVVRALRIIIGGGFRIIHRDRRSGRCYVVIERDGIENSTPLSTVSSGFRAILAISCDVMRWLMRDEGFTTLDMARAIVLIDEVEAHLHPRWKATIMDGLRRALPNVTFIATTHDPLCLRGMHDGEVMVLSRVPGELAGSELPVTVETLTTLPDVTKLTVEQLLTSDFFDLFDTDDPVMGRDMAELADALTEDSSMEAERRAALLRKFKAEVAGALPVGSTEVARLVQEAVAEYLHNRRKRPVAERQSLREDTKARIRRALEAG